MKIGVIGLGRMGSGIAGSLLKAGHEVVVHNRTPGKAEALVAAGAKRAADAAAACRGDVVVTMLSNDAAVEAVTLGRGGIRDTLAADALHVGCSTIGLELADRLASAHAEAGQRYVAAPVFGRPDAAAAGKLFVLAAGGQVALDAARPVFEAIGQRTFVISDVPRDALLVKLTGNFLIASMVEALGEAAALARKGGIDGGKWLDVMTSTLFNAPIYKSYGALIVEQRFEPAGFAAPLGHKDIRLAMAAASALAVPMPLASLLNDRFLRLAAHQGTSLDWSAIAGLAADDAGLASS